VRKMYPLYSKIKQSSIPEISIKQDVYRKINAYADLCHNEISALGSVSIVNNKILIDDVFLFEQVVSGSSTILSQEDVSKFMCDYIRKGKDPSKLKFWWHSHVNMETFWSGTDTNTIDHFSSDWMISMVSNKRNEFKLRLDLFTPFRMYMDDLPLNVDYDKSFNTIIREEINAKVKDSYSLPNIVNNFIPGRQNTQPYRLPDEFSNIDITKVKKPSLPVHSLFKSDINVAGADTLEKQLMKLTEPQSIVKEDVPYPNIGNKLQKQITSIQRSQTNDPIKEYFTKIPMREKIYEWLFGSDVWRRVTRRSK